MNNERVEDFSVPWRVGDEEIYLGWHVVNIKRIALLYGVVGPQVAVVTARVNVRRFVAHGTESAAVSHAFKGAQRLNQIALSSARLYICKTVRKMGNERLNGLGGRGVEIPLTSLKIGSLAHLTDGCVYHADGVKYGGHYHGGHVTSFGASSMRLPVTCSSTSVNCPEIVRRSFSAMLFSTR
tara:strand:- start:1682 stop:2227 length:546 start_codon:yes stop_codon:yes gene_type:complete